MLTPLATLFALSLSFTSTSSLDFGHINASRYTGKLTYTPVTPATASLWSFNWAGFGIGSDAFNTTSSKVVIDADTGLNYTRLPPSVVASYHAKVAGSAVYKTTNWYSYPCNETLPTFTFGASTAKYTISADQLVYGYLADNVTCLTAIQSSGDEASGTFGTPFLAGLYTVYDYGAKRIGFATATSPNY
jgi:aspergillopepsin I